MRILKKLLLKSYLRGNNNIPIKIRTKKEVVYKKKQRDGGGGGGGIPS